MQHPLETLREYYLDCFRQCVDNARVRFDQMATELLLELPSSKHPEYCHRLYRVDIIGKRDGKDEILEVNVDPQAVRWRRGTLPRVAAVTGVLVWNGIEFLVEGARPKEPELIAWAMDWLDASESRSQEPGAFEQVVHSVSPPQSCGQGYEFSVDFGTAPMAAFNELLELIAEDASRVLISS